MCGRLKRQRGNLCKLAICQVLFEFLRHDDQFLLFLFNSFLKRKLYYNFYHIYIPIISMVQKAMLYFARACKKDNFLL